MATDLWLREIAIDLMAEPPRLAGAIVHHLHAPFDIAPHHHVEELQLDLIRGCAGRIYQAGRWLRFTGDLALVSYPHTTHGYHLEPDPAAPIEPRVHNVKLRCRVSWALTATRLLPAIARPAAAKDNTPSPLDEAAEDLLRHLGDPTFPAIRALIAAIELLQHWPSRAAPADLRDAANRQPNTALDPDVEAAVTLIEERLDAPPSAAELAERVGISPRHLARLFRRSTGMTPHRYATIRRLDRARVLLLRGERNIAEVADELGFASHATFTRWFRQLTGETPQAYRSNPSVF